MQPLRKSRRASIDCSPCTNCRSRSGLRCSMGMAESGVCFHCDDNAKSSFRIAATQSYPILGYYGAIAMETGLKNRVAIVAASSQGIGKATALAFAAEGAHLALCARQQGPLEDVAREAAERFSVQTFTAAFDVSDDSAVRIFVQAAHQKFGRVDVCVTNAGGPPAKPFLSTT